MNNYLFHLLKLFIENGPLTEVEIGYYENISKRTVNKRIGELNNILGQDAHISKKVDRYILEIKNYHNFVNLETQFLKGELNLNDPIKRQSYIIEYLIKQHNYCVLDDISEVSNTSVSVVSKDIKEINETLSRYHGKIISKTGQGVKLQFESDYDLMIALRNCVLIYKTTDLQFKTNVLLKLEELKVTNETKNNILNQINTLRLAKEYGYTLMSYPPCFKPLWDNGNHIIEKLRKILTQILWKNMNSYEEIFILSPLNLISNPYLDKNTVQQVQKENYKIIKPEIDKLLSFGLNPEIIYERMKWHILFLINRSILGIDIDETLPQNVSQKYPIALDLSESIAKNIFHEYRIRISNNEVRYLVIFFEMFLEDTNKITNKIKIAFVGRIRSSMMEFIENKLIKVFDNISVKTFINSEGLKSSHESYILIFSDKIFKYNSTPVLNVSIAFRSNALSTIVPVSIVEHMIDDKLCTMNVSQVKASNYFEAVEKIINSQVKIGELNDSFRERWLQREKTTNNIFSNGVAIPHAIDTSKKDRILLSIGIVQNDIAYKGRKIKLIFLIGIPEQLSQQLIDVTSHLYDLIGIISRNKVLYENVVNYDVTKPLIQITEGV